jgi:DNA polymerase-3 subunit gamma/tau
MLNIQHLDSALGIRHSSFIPHSKFRIPHSHVSYKVLARKWRPQRFDDVIGQRGVTQTLRNAIAAGRIAQSFVFAGPRGVGKTTTARILARGLNCQNGPTAEPCGTCDACVEIAEGRDMDVLEIDAATHTQVDKVREIIIAGLGMAPVRDRYKVFIIDEVHRLSQQAFDALLKSIEEPPPHVVFMMATTEVDKVPATIQSRSQVFELKTIGVRQIADQLRRIADAEGLTIDDAALMLIARAGDGSMRDAQSALDQVIAFAGSTIAADDVTMVLGLVRRELLFDIADAVAREDGAAAFALANQAVESGYDVRIVVRELARLTRDLLVLRIDPTRVADPEIAADAERDRLKELAARFSAEDLMRAFDVLTKAEYDIRGSMQPRYQLEMALVRWIHLRHLVPLTDVIQGLRQGSGQGPERGGGPLVPRAPASIAATAKTSGATSAHGPAPAKAAVRSPTPSPAATATAPAVEPIATGRDLKEAFFDEIRKSKKFFHGTVVAQAQRIDVEQDRIVFAFAPQHRALRLQLEQSRSWLEAVATGLAGRKMAVVGVEGTPADQRPPGAQPDQRTQTAERQAALRERALADSGVQAMLDVFAAEIRDVEEM